MEFTNNSSVVFGGLLVFLLGNILFRFLIITIKKFFYKVGSLYNKLLQFHCHFLHVNKLNNFQISTL